MQEEKFEKMKSDVLAHMQDLFEQMEGDMQLAHQEKYALLEDGFGQASDIDELRIAFEQWYQSHAEDLDLEYSSDELWENATVNDEEDDLGEETLEDEEDDDEDFEW